MRYAPSGKRTFDVLGSGALLVASSPILAAAAAAIWLEDRHSPLFRQHRVGRNGDTFTIVKFRSMKIDTRSVASADASEAWVTKVGRIIRRTNLDELPQLWCVLRGDMSLVGPRPALPSQTQLVAMRQRKGANGVRPGLTGLAQLRAYDGMPDEEKSDHDAQYASSVSMRADITILVGTIAYLFRKPPTY
jgi:lipopolysaccharide/colanic/teichoic acid biosynthesis glycosyltransferase